MMRRKHDMNQTGKQHSLYETAFEHAPIGMAVIDACGVIQKVNQALCQLLGYSEEELPQLTYQELTHPEDLKADASILADVNDASDRSAFQLEKRYVHKQGHPIWVTLHLKVRRDEAGQPEYFVAQIVDMTERKKSEKRLRKIEKRHEMFTEHAMDILVSTTEDGIVEYISPAVTKILGYEAEQMIGQDSFSYFHPEDAPRVRRREYGLEGMHISRVRHAAGHYLWFETKVKLIVDEAGTVTNVIGVGREMTERKKTEADLIRSREELIEILQNQLSLTFKLIRARDTFYFAIVSGQSEKYLCCSPSEVLGKSLEEVFDESSCTVLNHYGERAWSGERVFFEMKMNDRYYYHSMNVLQRPDGESEIIVSVLDITEHKRSETELKLSQSKLSQAQRITRMGFYEWVAETNRIVLSEEIRDLIGGTEVREHSYTMEQLLKRIHPDDQERIRQRIETSRTTRQLNEEYRVLQEDGRILHMHITGELLTDDDGQPQYMFGTVQDITERKQTELLLKESVKRYQSLKIHNPDGVFTLLLNTDIQEVNPAVLQLTGYQEQELIGLPFAQLLHPDDRPKLRKRLTAARKGRELRSISFRLRHKSGYDVEVLSSPATIVIDERVVGFYVIVKDMTESRKHDELMKQAEKLSLAGQLAAGIAHEIRNPLTSVKGFIQLIATAPSVKSQYIDIIQTELDRIELIVSELLVLAKPHNLQFREDSIEQIVQDVVTLMAPQATLHAIEVKHQCAPGLLAIRCDSNQLKQVFINFIKNAIEACPNGGWIQIEVQQGEGGSIHISFTDNGCGIPEHILQKMGDPFLTTKKTGTGLGFMISQKIIENHQGQLHITSKEGEGTTVMVTLPTVPA
ncbi:PAS domain S-box protein [Marinicrinis sediminis]|uniref:histidine kinase n=1 Tax=Marinicrinis sediminis TaxID=1652465 RepID=A0ABW5RC91_9BACL